jgi:hypothetical protein
MDSEGNVKVTTTDGFTCTLRAPLGEDMELIENLVGASGSRIRAMCAAVAALSIEPLTLETVLKWRFSRIKEVSEGLKCFPDFSELA